MFKPRIRTIAVIATATVLALSGCGSGGTGQATSSDRPFSGRTLTVASPGGALTEAETKAYFKPFEEATGAKVKVAQTDYGSMPSLLKSTVEAGNPAWDLVTGVDAVLMNNLAGQDLLQNMDSSGVPGIDKLDPQFVEPYGVATEVDAVVATHNPSHGAKALPDTNAFFDVKNYPGTRAAPGPDAGQGTVACQLALQADGVPASELAPIDIPRCLKVWDKVKSSIKVWWATGSEMAQNMVDVNMDYCMCFDGRVQQARKAGLDWDYSLEGAASVTAWIVQPKGAENGDMVRELLKTYLDPKQQAVFVQSIGYSTPNPEAEQYLPEDIKEYLASSKANFPKLLKLTTEQTVVLGKHSDEVERAWSAWARS